MKITKGDLRNITSGILHTDIGNVYLFFENYIGAKGIMTHHLPSACKAIQPIIKRKLSDEWFTEEWIKDGLNESVILQDLTDDEEKEYWASFEKYNSEMWNTIKDKTIAVTI